METFVQISKINDFIFCPKSIYLHSVYESFEEGCYHETPQKIGKIAHESIDNSYYSSRSNVLQGIAVFSEKLGLCGKIDIFDITKGELVERKFKIKQIFDGYKYQLYAQMFALLEMGYSVKSIFLHSLSDNKRYKIEFPDKRELASFLVLIQEIREFNLSNFRADLQDEGKCLGCIYKPLCK